MYGLLIPIHLLYFEYTFFGSLISVLDSWRMKVMREPLHGESPATYV